jgi:hypothetical protein
MTTPRPSVLTAIAWRDLRSELSGRQGLGLPLIALALLIPAAVVQLPGSGSEVLPVRGDIPEAVLAVPGVEQANTGTGFRTLDGVVNVYDYRIPPAIRAALDDADAKRGIPIVRVEAVRPPLRVPDRSLFFALISASTLTGAVSTSIGGERARNTLQALLSAAITRLEIVLGKWLAWTAFGALGGLIASFAAIAAGVQAPGAWLLAVPLVPATTVALGLWLVRRTEDVIAGTSVSLRVLPAVLGVTGLLSYGLSEAHPVLGALVPLGGALMAAGDLWDGAALPTSVALLSTIAATAALLRQTATDLEQHAPRTSEHGVRPLRALVDGAMSAAIWWSVVPGPVLWGWAGNAAMTDVLTVDRGLFAASALFAMLTVVGLARALHPSEKPDLATFSAGRALAAGVPTGLALALLPAWAPTHPWLAQGAERMAAGLVPELSGGASLPLALFVLSVQELWFRGVMQRRAGWLPVAVVYAAVLAPFHPLAGLVAGLALGWAAQKGVSTALVGRWVAWGVAIALGLAAS